MMKEESLRLRIHLNSVINLLIEQHADREDSDGRTDEKIAF